MTALFGDSTNIKFSSFSEYISNILLNLCLQGKSRPPRQQLAVHRTFDSASSTNSTTSLLSNSTADSESTDTSDEFQRSRGKQITRRRGAIKHQR